MSITEGLNIEFKKKFYRDFSESELVLFDELQDYMADCYVFIPAYVIDRMIHRDIIPGDIKVLDQQGRFIKESIHKLNDVPEYVFVSSILEVGVPYEFSNEGKSNPISPYRVVWCAKNGDYTYFVKTPVPPARGSVRIIDVWRKVGDIPLSPPREQRAYFAKGMHWNIYPILARLVSSAKAEVMMHRGDDDEARI